MGFTRATVKPFYLRLAIDGPAGSGKAQPLDALVLTPTGWQKMGDLKVGDAIVDPDGGVAQVSGIYPRGKMDVFRITFTDGSSTRCTADHLWLTRTVLDRDSGRKERCGVRTTAEIADSIRLKGKHNHSIPQVEPPDLLSNDAPLPLDPYALGLLLGNACFQEKFVTFSSDNPDIITDLARMLPEGVEARRQSEYDYRLSRTAPSGPNALMNIVRELGLDGHNSVDKFIPQRYLWTSAENRLALLQGLMDTDGYADRYTAEFSTSSRQLALDVQFLVRSLGGTCHVSERVPAYEHNGEKRLGHRSYRLFLCMPGDLVPFRTKVKADRYKPRTKYQPRRFVESIVYEAHLPVQCISATSKRSLYVTDDWIVTHNTFTSLEVATFIAQQYGDLPPAFIDTERGSASKYASRFAFDVIDMAPPFHPDRFVKGIQMAVDAGYKVLVIDSLSHAWNGPGGLLELVDNFAKKYGGNGFAGWKDATPIQTRLIDAIIGANLHIIACMRAKMDYAQDKDERGRTQITKVGLAPVQREGMEYEFDVVGDMTVAHALSISKTRCAELTDQLFVKPGRDFARILWNWTQSGVTREQFSAQAATATPVAIPAPTAPAVVPTAKQAQIAPATEPPPWEQPNPADELPAWMGPPTTAPALVNDGNGTTHVVIEDRAQFEDHIAGILAQQAAPAAPTGQPDLPPTPSSRPGNGGNGTAKTGNGGSASMASEVTAVFPGLCAKMVADQPYYRNAQGGADMFRILRAAKAEGFSVVNTANMADVVAKLTERGLRHAQEEAAKAARKQEGTDAGH